MSGPSQLHCFGEPKGQSLTRNRPVFRIWLRLRRTSARGALPSIKIDLPSIVFEMSTRRWARVPPKLEPLPPDHQVLSLRDLKHSDTVLGISKVGQKIAISVECLATINPKSCKLYTTVKITLWLLWCTTVVCQKKCHNSDTYIHYNKRGLPLINCEKPYVPGRTCGFVTTLRL